MPKTFIVGEYKAVITKNALSKRMSLRVKNGQVYATIPRSAPYVVGKLFVQQNLGWIKQKLSDEKTNWLPSSADYKQDKPRAKKLIEAKLNEWNYYYKFEWGRVAIRDQSTRWGSASSSGNLNFSWRILYLPESLQDYIVVHELCHLKHHNHSADFWALVAQTIPDHKDRRKQLKTFQLG